MLVVLDGWGVRAPGDDNAIAHARTPHLQEIYDRHPATTLEASGERVGLPKGQMGNSEVGHQNLGAGRVVWQEVTRIYQRIRSGEFFENEALLKALQRGRERAVHLIGLVSDGCVHSHQNHLFSLLEMARRRGVEDVCVHAITDGRDTPPTSGAGFIRHLQERIREIGVGRIATVVGRYYAMDRDKRWDRTARAYHAMVAGEGKAHENPVEAIRESYAQDVTDEFIEPVVITERGKACPRIQDGDGVIFFNWRADRMRQIVRALAFADFQEFHRKSFPAVTAVSFTEYDKAFRIPFAFEQPSHRNILPEVLAQSGLRQLRIAETEKYAHVTYFFNCGRENEFPGEERILIPSPKVATYDLKPEMSALQITRRLLDELGRGEFDFVLVNYANADMVGHTGKQKETVIAVETIDLCLGWLDEKIRALSGRMLVTGDHGNAEQMVDEETGEPHTAHTTNPVPLIVIDDSFHGSLRSGGALENVAPTLLELMRIEKPLEMTAESLLRPRATAL